MSSLGRHDAIVAGLQYSLPYAAPTNLHSNHLPCLSLSRRLIIEASQGCRRPVHVRTSAAATFWGTSPKKRTSSHALSKLECVYNHDQCRSKVGLTHQATTISSTQVQSGKTTIEASDADLAGPHWLL